MYADTIKEEVTRTSTKEEQISRVKREREKSRSRSRRRRRDRKRRRSSRSSSRDRKRRRSRSSDGRIYGVGSGKGLRPRRKNEQRHRSLWDIQPGEAAEIGLFDNLPIRFNTTTGDNYQANVLTDRQNRTLYVGNLPLDVKEPEIRDFFNAVMIAAQGPDRKPGASVVGVFLNLKKRFSFVEFRSPIEATQAMDLDGLMFRGLALKMGRPPNYNPSRAPKSVPRLNLSRLGIVSNHVPNGPNKLYIGGIPYNLKEPQVRELLETYGPLRGLFLSFDPVTGLTKGYAFATYENESVTDAAIQGLHGLQIGDRTLVVRRHDAALNQKSDQGSFDTIVKEPKTARATTTLCMLQMVTAEDLRDPEEVADITTDIRTECQNFGNVLDIVIPAFFPDGKPEPGMGKVWVNFSNLEEAKACRSALQGRTFADRTVVVSYYDTEKFGRKEFI